MNLGIDASNIRGGGGVTHLTELLRAACPWDQGIQRIVVWGGQATLEKLPGKPWLRPIHDPLLDRSLPWRRAWQVSRLPRLAVAACDVLFTPGASSPYTTLPSVTMCQNMLPFEPAERRRFGLSVAAVQLRLLESTQRHAFQRADGVIFLTQYAQEVIQQRISPLPTRQAIIPHGIAAEFHLAPRPMHPRGFYSAERPFRMVYVSSVSAYKHQWHVAEAVAHLRQAGFPIVLDLVGPSYRPSLRRLEKVLERVDPGREFIRYVGPVAYQLLPPWYHRADVFVYASSCENLPIILLEAMAAGLPIACSNRGPMPEVLGQAGQYFDPENENEIAAALKVLIMDHELRRQCAQMAFEQSQAYTWERCARETLEFIAGVAARANAPCQHTPQPWV